jgi:hypothetical protein
LALADAQIFCLIPLPQKVGGRVAPTENIQEFKFDVFRIFLQEKESGDC